MEPTFSQKFMAWLQPGVDMLLGISVTTYIILIAIAILTTNNIKSFIRTFIFLMLLTILFR